MIKERNVATCVILSIVTIGIYGIYWFVKATDESKEVAGDTQLASGGMAVLLTIITCGIYGIYWAYKMGELNKIAREKYGMPAKDNSVLFLILEIIGLGLINLILIQSDLNEFAKQGTENGAM